MVTEYPQVNMPEIGYDRSRDTELHRYSRSRRISYGWRDLSSGHRGCVRLSTGKTIYLKAGDPTDRYFTNIAWSPTARPSICSRSTATKTTAALLPMMPKTGEKTGELYRETDEKYVEPLHPIHVPALGQQPFHHAEPQGWLQSSLSLHIGQAWQSHGKQHRVARHQSAHFWQVGSDGSARFQQKAQEHHHSQQRVLTYSEKHLLW